ncbi:response regulator [Pseudodesulfovibrio piezophilus]|uniref:histidine kinase n=1 Tax=Pseudodesulfovibrio piezophilus (strain DSM 21447 / JCM 15486 / C1TLV30) TaxID=1322246 RepID=M1WS41_PSEP2|nr:response regulator [Pseudodesulfovibrio piezophilus]CCH49949.1 Signal transduction histidine kinase [Pseudodesulfovibrio piezophilus C1TLV30]
MLRFSDIPIRQKLIFLFLVTGIIPLLIVGVVSNTLTVKTLIKKSFEELGSVQAIRKEQVEKAFDARVTDMSLLSESAQVHKALATLLDYKTAVNGLAELDLDVTTAEYHTLHKQLSPVFRKFIKEYGYYDLYLMDADDGHVLYSVLREEDIGTNLVTGPFKNSRLAEMWRKVVSTGRETVVDFGKYEPSGGIPSAFIGIPVRNDAHAIIGVFALQVQSQFITSLMDSRVGLGKTGESYLLNWDPLTDLFELRSNMETMGKGDYVVGYALNRHLDYWEDAVEAGQLGGHNTYKDSEGNEVLVAYDKLSIQGLNWYLISKINKSEVTAPTQELTFKILVLAAGLVLIIAFVAWFISRRITRPILEDVRFAKDISNGAYDTVLHLDQRDELGQLAEALNSMARNLADQHWLKSGKEGLDDDLRGEHDLGLLAKRFVKFFVTHMNAQLGALYLSDGEKLDLATSYAFTDRRGNFNSFNMGEGMVGQAALENETILFSDVDHGAPEVNYGAGQTMPSNFMITPIASEGVVLGVLLVGSLSPFTDLQKRFVEMNSENAAILFNAAQSRETIRKLLDDAQEQQKKLHLANKELEEQARALKESEAELQAQQEELRVTNEELEEQAKALKESESILQAQQEELRVTNEELEEHTQTLEEQKDAIRKKNSELIKAQEVVKQKAHDLEIASKYKSEFLANMSHELRTPLNSILILSQLFGNNKDGNLTPKQIESAMAIHSSGSDLLSLINEILDLSKVEAGKVELVIEDIPVKTIVNDIRRMFKDVAADKGLAFDVSVAPGLSETIKTDSQRLHQVLRNLLTNAFKFTRQGLVALTIDRPSPERTPDWLSQESAFSFAVRDEGIGIPQEQQVAIFEAFQQADGSTSRKYGGTGLGLSISKELVKLLGGAIYLESEEEKGSTFTIVLPEKYVPLATRAQAEFPSSRIEEEQTGEESFQAEALSPENAVPSAVHFEDEEPVLHFEASGDESRRTNVASRLPSAEFVEDDRNEVVPESKSLLIIEDDVNFAKIMRDFAQERSFKCIVAEDGETGLHFADFYKPSAIILDIGLPGIDGWTVMERLKDNPELRHIPVHFMSAADSSLDAMRMGAVGFLSKPVSLDKVADAFGRIENVISKPVSKLLLVEDDAIQRESIQQLIGNGDVETVAVATGHEAYEELNKGVYDCMILDLGLEDMSGFDLLEKIRRSDTTSRVPIIVYTGRDLTRLEENKLNRYAESIIIKGAKSPERLLDESALFLHRVESELPEDKQKMLKMVHDKEAVLSGKTILLVDDDMRNVFALSSVLEEKTMDVVIARNGLEAIDKLKEHDEIDLVLMDIMMPLMDGYEAMQAIRKEHKYAKLPMIALTAKAMKGDRSKCIEAGANDYLAKPVNTDKLLSMLRVWLY